MEIMETELPSEPLEFAALLDSMGVTYQVIPGHFIIPNTDIVLSWNDSYWTYRTTNNSGPLWDEEDLIGLLDV